MKIYVLFILQWIYFGQTKSILLRGKRAQDGQFPWLIQFQTIAPCGGVLLSPDWVLTAAQCVQDKRNSILLFASGLNGTNTKETVSVKATYIHPHYEPYSILPDRDYNIALLKLTKPFDMFNSKVILPNIPVKYDTNYTPCLIFGWQSYISPSSKVLAKPIQYSEVILNSWKLCTYMIKASANYSNVFCAMVEFKDEMKACAGNPGSPVVCENQQHQTALIGIASWTNFSLECGDLPTYLDLEAFRIWMNELIFNDKEVDKWKSKDRSTEEDCMYKEDSNGHDRAWNHTNFLQVNSQVHYWPDSTKIRLQNISHETSPGHQNLSYAWNRLHGPIFYKLNHTNVSSSPGYDMPYADIAKEPINDIYNHEEIGKSKNYRNDQITKDLNEKHFNSSNKSLLCNKKFDKTITEHNNNQIEVDDFEFLLPYNIEDITTSDSRIICCKSLYFLYIIFVCFYIITYT